MAKIDLKKDLKTLYKPSAKAVSVVDVPVMNFLMIDGSGNPNTSQDYAEAVEALYALSYALGDSSAVLVGNPAFYICCGT